MFRKLNYIILCVAVFMLIVMRLAVMMSHKTPEVVTATTTINTTQMDMGTLTVASSTFSVMIAQTPDETTRGLSGMTSLPQDKGMLFIFDDNIVRGFWMPDMHFAIDMVWIDSNWRVIGIAQHATPESYPKVFYSNGPAKYVLEVSDGASRTWGIATGTQLIFTAKAQE